MEYELTKYDEHYQSLDCKFENKCIKEVLETFIPKGRRILDIGCGTGLVYGLLRGRNRIISTDKRVECRRVMRKKFPNDPISVFGMNSTEALDKLFVGQWITCTFALHYLPYKDIYKILSNRSVCIVYNKPYLRRDSVYYGKKFKFIKDNLLKDIFIRLCLKVLPHKRFALCEAPFYDVIITTGYDNAKKEIRKNFKAKKGNA